MPKKLDPFHETLDRSKALLNRYKCVGGLQGRWRGGTARSGIPAAASTASTRRFPLVELRMTQPAEHDIDVEDTILVAIDADAHPAPGGVQV